MNHLLCAADLATGSSLTSGAAAGSKFDFTPVFLIISLTVAIALPIGLIILGKLKHKGSLLMTLKGMLGYFAFYMILALILSLILLPNYSDQNSTYVEASIYVTLQIICLEGGRFLLLFMGRKKRGAWGDGILFGAGYCLMDMIAIAFFLLPYLIIVLNPNVTQIDGVLRELRVFVKEENLVSGKEWRFLIKGMTSLVFFAMQMSSTLLMHISIQKNIKWLLFTPLAVDLLIMIPNRLSAYNVWFWKHNYVILPYLAVMAILCCLFTYIMWKNIYQAHEETVNLDYIEKLASVHNQNKKDEK